MSIAFKNNAIGPVSDTATTSISTSSFDCAIGDLIVVYFGDENGYVAPVISDTAGNTYTGITYSTLSGGGRQHGWYTIATAANAANVVTITSSSATGARIQAISYTGVSAYVSFEVADTSGTSITGAGLSASASGLLVGGVYSEGGTGTTFTVAGDLVNARAYATDYRMWAGDVIFSTTGTKTAAFTTNQSESMGLGAMLFSGTVSGGTTHSITGNISYGLTVTASAMTYATHSHSIIANITITLTFTATAMTFSSAAGTHAITGNISMTLGIAATLAYIPHLSYAITGNISMPLTVAASVIHYTHLLSGGKGIPGSNIFLFLKR